MALYPLFSPTHRHWTGDDVEVICVSTVVTPACGYRCGVTYRYADGRIFTLLKEDFDGSIPDPQNGDEDIRRFTPFVGE